MDQPFPKSPKVLLGPQDLRRHLAGVIQQECPRTPFTRTRRPFTRTRYEMFTPFTRTLEQIRPVQRSPDMILTSGGRGGHFHLKKSACGKLDSSNRACQIHGWSFSRKKGACGKIPISNRACQIQGWSFSPKKKRLRQDTCQKQSLSKSGA